MKAKDNPFSVERILKIRYRGADLDALAERLEEMAYRAAIVGPEGSGKTTLAEDLRASLENTGRKTKGLFINDSHPLTRQRRREFIRTLTPDTIVFLDGAGLISPLAWMTLKHTILKKAKGLVITAHSPGQLPTLTECRTTPTLLREITAELLDGREIPPREFLDEIYRRFGGNIRLALRQLYDVWADGLLAASREIMDDSP